MKFAFMSFSCPELTLDEMIAMAKKYGYDGIEPRISSNHKHGIELDSSESFRKECKQKSQESGVALCCIATSCIYANPQLNQQMIADTHKAIDLAGDVGASRIRAAKVTMDEAFQVLKPWIKHVHFHDGVTKEDGNLVFVPIGEGDINHQRAVELLKSNEYNGLLSGEWIGWEPYEMHLPRELLTMKRYE